MRVCQIRNCPIFGLIERPISTLCGHSKRAYVALVSTLRALAVLIGASALSSCQVKVDLVVANLTNQPVNIMLGSIRTLLPAHTEQRLRDWPDDHRLVILTPSCARSFDLDEHYSPTNDWRYSTFDNIRRFGIIGTQIVRVMLPDRAHSAIRHEGFNAPVPPDLDLTPSPKSCSSPQG